MRASNLRLKDFVNALDPGKTGFVNREQIRSTLADFGLSASAVDDAVICMDAGYTDRVSTKTILDAFKAAANTLGEREKKEKKLKDAAKARDEAREAAEKVKNNVLCLSPATVSASVRIA